MTIVGSEEAKSAGAKSYFDVLFVGLFCFKEHDGIAVMPDGTEPDDPKVQPYQPFLVVNPKDVIDAQSNGWDGNDPAHTEQGIYTFSKCTIDITKATTFVLAALDKTQHVRDVPKLTAIDKNFQFATSGGNIIAAITLGQGTLEFLRRPDRKSGEEGIPTVTRLRVPHDGEVVVTVAVEGEPQPRVLALNPGGDLAIVNGCLEDDPAKKGDPLTLFGKIAQSGKFTPATSFQSLVKPSVPVIGEDYQVFKIKVPIRVMDDGPGCCPPP